jgi:hypothetical protein
MRQTGYILPVQQEGSFCDFLDQHGLRHEIVRPETMSMISLFNELKALLAVDGWDLGTPSSAADTAKSFRLLYLLNGGIIRTSSNTIGMADFTFLSTFTLADFFLPRNVKKLFHSDYLISGDRLVIHLGENKSSGLNFSDFLSPAIYRQDVFRTMSLPGGPLRRHTCITEQMNTLFTARVEDGHAPGPLPTCDSCGCEAVAPVDDDMEVESEEENDSVDQLMVWLSLFYFISFQRLKHFMQNDDDQDVDEDEDTPPAVRRSVRRFPCFLLHGLTVP